MTKGCKIRLSPLRKAAEIWLVANPRQDAAIEAARNVARLPAKTDARIMGELGCPAADPVDALHPITSLELASRRLFPDRLTVKMVEHLA
ncbi:hypothetical protein QA641_15375 [Bradyrhizobium sp. CB1650]|uniref:hypothetical protein n=1 Tax=Bradyrhizobium sp. CB1650 TaxID=3039153 RepID=UPI002434F643|nr:hypothetical protein [Bradyrhizobium sp. CB1650]WGD55143.1 hypothetical protein QA641_15375 [Bradyrhizobium sp. CB1650]